MKAYDFEYDGLRLSDFGYTICSFSSQSLETVSAGSKITFTTVSTYKGTKYELVDMKYNECLETTFQICKDQCDNTDLEISMDELRRLNNWLNRKQFLKFRVIEEDYAGMYFEGSFNISRLDLEGVTVGLELTLITNRPFALLEPRTIKLSGTEADWDAYVYDRSDEIGYIYPDTEITLDAGGKLVIYSENEDRRTVINNCESGEIIHMNSPVIESSVSDHQLQNDFNWNFMRISNEFRNKKNHFTVSLPCTIKMTYSPVAKIAF